MFRFKIRDVLWLLVVAALLSSAFIAHVVATGIGVPYQDPTPAQAAYERYHLAISQPMFFAGGAVWLAVGVAAFVCVSSWLLGLYTFRNPPS
jgi:hypothetical protein